MQQRLIYIFKGLSIGFLSLVLFALDLFLQLFFSKPYQGQRSDHFNGRRFFNPHVPRRRFLDFLTWTITRTPRPWPKEVPQKTKYMPPPLKYDHAGHMLVTFINHSTVLIQWDGKNILTDPVWSERCSPFKHIGPKRVHQPGVTLENLPPIDIILLSHNHYDHLDVKTLKIITKKDHPLIITGLGVKALLNRHNIRNVVELDWWQKHTIEEKFVVTFTPAQHFSSRRFGDRDLTLWGSFFVQGTENALFFAGDTGYGPHFKQIKDRCGIPSLALLPIGIYEPRWLMEPIHMSPEDAVQAHFDLESQQSLGIHFGTFELADEGLYDPPHMLREAMKKHGLQESSFWILEPGENKKSNKDNKRPHYVFCS